MSRKSTLMKNINHTFKTSELLNMTELNKKVMITFKKNYNKQITKTKGDTLSPIANITATSVNPKVYRKAPHQSSDTGLYQGALRILFFLLCVMLIRLPTQLDINKNYPNKIKNISHG